MEQNKGGQEGGKKASQNLFTDYSDSPLALRRKIRDAKPIKPEEGKRSDILFFAALGILLLTFASFFAVGYYKSHKRPLTIEELHDLNFEGKLDSDEGYVHDGIYSFIKLDGFWYTALQSQSAKTLYNFAFRYSPRDLASLPVTGTLDTSLFNSAAEYYITFNPTAQNLSHTVLAVNDFNQHMINAFKKFPIAACDRNETVACADRPIITCENTEKVVVYIKNEEIPSVEFEDNCIIISGQGFDQVKGVDRVLYKFYNIMP